jgi:hypothetical protein
LVGAPLLLEIFDLLFGVVLPHRTPESEGLSLGQRRKGHQQHYGCDEVSVASWLS